MRVNDAVSGILIMLVSVVLFVNTLSFPDPPGFQYGAGVFPRAVLTILFLAGLWLTVKGFISLRDTPLIRLESWARQPRSWIVLLLIIGGMLLYVLASELLGFVLVSAIIIFVLLVATGGREHLVSAVVLAVVFPFILQFVFVKALRVPLPPGLFGGFF